MLKKIFLMAAVSAVMLLVFNACNKDETLPTQKTGVTTDRVKASPSAAEHGVSAQNGLLVFEDIDDVNSVLDDLELLVHDSDSIFIETYDHLSIDDLNDMEDQLGYNYEQPLIDFESGFQYTSLRSAIEAEWEVWSENEGSDDTDPDNHFIMDEYIRTILNEHAEVMIGGSIYKFFNVGYIEITDGDFTTLYDIRNGDDPSGFSNVVLYEWGSSSTDRCKTNKWSHDFKTNGSYRIKGTVGICNYPWQCSMVARVKSYKKKNGKWKKYRTNLSVLVKGYGCEKNGELSTTLNGPKQKYPWVKKKKSRSVRLGGFCKTKSGNVWGVHWSDKVGTLNTTLTF